jgi:hypothetical protein
MLVCSESPLASTGPPHACPRSFDQLPIATSLLRSIVKPSPPEMIPPSLMGHVSPTAAGVILDRCMRSGRRVAVLVGSALSLGSCIATPTQQGDAGATAVASLSPSEGAVSRRRVRVEVDGAGIAVEGARVSSDPEALKSALRQAAGAELDVVAQPDAPPAQVVAALTVDAGPHVARRILSWQDVRVEISEHQAATSEQTGAPVPASIFAWRASPPRATRLWSVSDGPTIKDLGPIALGEAKTESAIIASLKHACAPSGCRLVVELREESLLEVLRAWQRIVAAVSPRFGLHVSSAPSLARSRDGQAVEHLPPAMIQAVVWRAFERFKQCYEDGLARDPKLEGRVSVRFVIERDGIVKASTDGGSDITDMAVRDCVVRKFIGLKFPAPETDVVTVDYPITLAPG